VAESRIVACVHAKLKRVWREAAAAAAAAAAAGGDLQGNEGMASSCEGDVLNSRLRSCSDEARCEQVGLN
jgi:hypothetical protein